MPSLPSQVRRDLNLNAGAEEVAVVQAVLRQAEAAEVSFYPSTAAPFGELNRADFGLDTINRDGSLELLYSLDRQELAVGLLERAADDLWTLERAGTESLDSAIILLERGYREELDAFHKERRRQQGKEKGKRRGAQQRVEEFIRRRGRKPNSDRARSYRGGDKQSPAKPPLRIQLFTPEQWEEHTEKVLRDRRLAEKQTQENIKKINVESLRKRESEVTKIIVRRIGRELDPALAAAKSANQDYQDAAYGRSAKMTLKEAFDKARSADSNVQSIQDSIRNEVKKFRDDWPPPIHIPLTSWEKAVRDFKQEAYKQDPKAAERLRAKLMQASVPNPSVQLDSSVGKTREQIEAETYRRTGIRY